MSKFIMGFQVFLILIFFTGKGLEANLDAPCFEIIEADFELESLLKFEGIPRLSKFCTTMPDYFFCMNFHMKLHTGMNIKELASHWLIKETKDGKMFKTLVNLEDVVDEVCTEGSKLQELYLQDGECFRRHHKMKGDLCKKQSASAVEIYREIQNEGKDGEYINECVFIAFNLGCLGAALHEECGEEAFERYKDLVKKIGFFKSGICSSNLMQTLNTTFVESLNISDSRRSLYRTIFSLKKRRK